MGVGNPSPKPSPRAAASLEQHHCIVCGSYKRNCKFSKNDIWIYQCRRCGHQFAEGEYHRDTVAKIYDGQYFQGGGIGYIDYLADGPTLLEKGQYYGKLLEKEFWPGKLLDVGTAAGFILKSLSAYGWQGKGLEPNQRIAQFGRKQLKLDIYKSTFEDFQCDEQYDFIFMIQVLSHFYDLKQALQVATQLTRPGGFWLIETWDRKSWPARLQGRYWRAYQPPADHHWFSAEGLTELAQQYGFTKVKQGRVVITTSRPQFQHHLRYQRGGWLSNLIAKLVSVIPASLSMPWTIRDRIWLLFERSTDTHPLDFPRSDSVWATKLPTPPMPSPIPHTTDKNNEV